MIDKELFEKIKKESEAFFKEREVIIGRSRQVLQSAKKAIFAGHEGNLAKADSFINEAEENIAFLLETYQQDNRLRAEGSYKASLEEYVEAKTFLAALRNQPITIINNITIGPEEYLGGLSDMTGELVRQAVLAVTRGQTEEIKRYHDIIEEAIKFMLELYLSGMVRLKFDAAKKNLQRLEEILYDLEIRKK